MGHIQKSDINRLWLIQGEIYAADASIYKKVKGIITHSINNSGYAMSKTNEIAKIKNIDPLKISHLRVRGMWNIDHPDKIFTEIKPKLNILNALITKEKYDSLNQEHKNLIQNSENIKMQEIKLPDPNNPMKIIPSYHIFIPNKAKI